ncbi:hypothetical protein BGI41_06910 [Methanobrevibacter sp. 87.7]|uniref:M48 family metallopeptidase n=1 Tax=Methanobrevibacter sp. 87.7 TaxID=387957 RepID=UPI000B50CD9A|nr:SprT family zinc-dependent metalloprotease [Methanobrevibacter sp. 87.7]OWT32587.1 hypothetical protein BGI41_06910 [Methanobrevibacter sp. 87.7]
MKSKIEINNIPITIERKKIKNMYLRVLPPNGEIKISAPLSISQKDIIKFANSKSDWIKNKQEKVIKESEKAKKRQIKYITGETHYLWGKPYTLQIIKKNKKYNNVFIDNNKIYLPVKENSSFENRQKTMIEWYREEIKQKIPEILETCIKIVGKRPNEWRVKNMKTRWGTCNVQKKRIWINLQLCKKSPECLKYVLIHELTHLYIPNHGKDFKNLMNQFYPNWKETKNLLKKEKYY